MLHIRINNNFGVCVCVCVCVSVSVGVCVCVCECVCECVSSATTRGDFRQARSFWCRSNSLLLLLFCKDGWGFESLHLYVPRGGVSLTGTHTLKQRRLAVCYRTGQRGTCQTSCTAEREGGKEGGGTDSTVQDTHTVITSRCLWLTLLSPAPHSPACLTHNQGERREIEGGGETGGERENEEQKGEMGREEKRRDREEGSRKRGSSWKNRDLENDRVTVFWRVTMEIGRASCRERV